MKRNNPVIGEFYRHFKGGIYQICALAKDSTTQEDVVVYQALYAPFTCWVRPLEEFMSETDFTKYPKAQQKNRFEKINPNDISTSQLCRKQEKEEINSQNEQTVGKVSENELIKALKSGQPDRYLSDKMSEEQIAEQGFLALLDAKTFREKRQLFIGLKPYMDERMISNIAVAFDIVLEEKTLEEQYDSILRCLDTYEHYEGGRLR